ncbi:MAG TPA: nuclear transport factor 2 family protein [Gemmatimonadales bacterium]|nr:nuclear transport factor 2 family protein [Gemmatimonadales bacterium]
MTRLVRSGRGLGGMLILGVGLAAAGNGMPARPTRQDDSRILLQNEQAWARAAVDGDADRMASYMADEYVELAWQPAEQNSPAHWASTGKSDWVNSVRSRKEVYTSVELRNLAVHLQGSLAVVTGEYSQKGTSDSRDITASGIYANTWAKRGGRWLVVHSVFP